jgi:adenylate cyclase
MEAARGYLMAPWRSGAGTTILVVAAAIHTLLGLYSLSTRRSFQISKTDVVQLLLGFVTPPLLLTHALTMRLTGDLVPGFEESYGTILSVYWVIAPIYAFQQLLAVVAVWGHASIGLYSWLVLKPVWPRLRHFVLPLFFLIPLISLLGFVSSGNEVIEKLATDSSWQNHINSMLSNTAPAAAILKAANERLIFVYFACVLLAVLIWFWRAALQSSRQVRVLYDTGETVIDRSGLSILEMSLRHSVPHAHICNGRGRCGTCRIDVLFGSENLSTATELERRTLDTVYAGTGSRLACQARLQQGTITVVKLLPPYVDLTAAQSPQTWLDLDQHAAASVASLTSVEEASNLPPMEVAP